MTTLLNHPSRRELIKTGLLTTIFASGLRLPHGLAATISDTPDPFRGLKVGITSYSVRKLGFDDAVKATRRIGVRYISLKDFHLPLKSTPEERREVARKLKEAGLILLGCGVVTMKNDEAEIRHAFEYAKDAGIATIVANPDPASLGILDRMVKEYNIRIAIHNHGPEDKRYPTPDVVATAIEGHDQRIGFCIDIGHTARAGVDPAAAIRKHARRLYEIHFKDVDRAVAEGKTVECGRGVIDLPAVLRALRDVKFQYHVALEYEKDADDPVPGMAESIGYIRGVLTTM
jgi:sugar phosphate isomerase/epimerase